MNLPYQNGLGPAAIAFGLCIGTVCFSGCGGDETVAKTSNSQGEQSKPKAGHKTPDSLSPRSKANKRRKEFDGIDYDVFFDDPLAIAANTQRIAVPTVTSAPGQTTTPSQPPSESDTKPAVVGDTDWRKVIPKDILEAEVKRIRNRLTRCLQSVGNYNQNIFQIPPDAATLAMLANIAASHPDAVSWKANAKYVRDLAAKMVENELLQGRKSFQAVEGPFLNIVDVLNGSPPADLPDTENNVPFPDVAEFGLLMKRLDRMEKWAKTNVASEDGFKQYGDTAESEAYLVAAISTVIATEGYGFFDDDQFKGYAAPMLDAALKMASAVKSGNFSAFDEGMNAVSQKCTQCHGDYRE